MLNFKPVELSDFNDFKEFYKDNTELSCEITFVNLILWQKAYQNMIAIDNGQLFIKNGNAGDESFRLPVGESLEKGIEKLKNYCGGNLPTFWSEDSALFRDFCNKYSNFYNIEESRDDFEYIYLQKNLSLLSGKKYHSKRNHISAFSKKFNWRSALISKENIPEILKCAEKWYVGKEAFSDEYLECEKNGIKTILENMEMLSIKGCAIYVEEEIVAFAIGSPVNENVFNIHIEKALDEYSGAYAVINREFAKMLSEYKYINREDDMGIDGLRTAKLSYKPEILLKKYLCVPKE